MSAKPGFKGASASKTLALLSLGSSALFRLAGGAASEISLTAPQGTQEPWGASLARAASSQLVFATASEAVVGASLLYVFRILERRTSTRVHTTRVVLTTVFGVLVQLSLCWAMPDASLATGPYVALFSLLPLYFAFVPRSTTTKYLGDRVRVTDKSFVYALALQLALGRGAASAVPAIIGTVCGFVMNRKGLVSYCVWPESVVRFASQFIEPLLSGQGPTATDATQNDEARRQTGGPDAVPVPIARPPAAQAPPSEDQISVLVSMGYSRRAVLDALARNGNDSNRAANDLLSS